MKRRTLGLLFVTALLFAVGAIAVACGGEEQLTMEEYFPQLDALAESTNSQLDALDQKYPQAFQDPDETRAALEEANTILNDAFSQLDDMNPPDEVKQAHDEFRASVGERRATLQAISDQLVEVETPAELLQALEPQADELDAANARLEAACLALQGIADDNGIVVDLECPQQ
jgi:hypothetical protein